MVKGFTICPHCGKEQYHDKLNCKYCGTLLFDMSEEFKETLRIQREDELLEKKQREMEKQNAQREMEFQTEQRGKRQKEPMFTDEQILVTGLYPKNSFFKGLLISRILRKK